MEKHLVEAFNKLAVLKNIIIEVEYLDEPPEEAFIWGRDPFYGVHRNVSLELMHNGYLEDARKLFEDYVNYQYPERIEQARADIKNVWDGLRPLTRDNIESLYKQHKGVVVLTDIYFTMPYANYVFVNVSEEERFAMIEDEYSRAMPLDWILDEETSVDKAFLDVYNTKINNGRFPFVNS
ncbi:hypothetical protein [Sphingobacterium deserti]|uniref:Uncharacterized protein n=1 Tax=Sphingobacterium deserti TaxID=1229276 RepID=A0A0B8T188_9SPHI|nr:hypothetical protein [Sphingobacterium deserti]KGE14602.1 hypothetical protein DI53_1631 [Sphingobacterium deserti]